LVGCQAAIAGKPALTKTKSKDRSLRQLLHGIRGAAAPLNRMSASSAAAFDLDLDPQATSEG
jgi:hypothetical protein